MMFRLQFMTLMLFAVIIYSYGQEEVKNDSVQNIEMLESESRAIQAEIAKQKKEARKAEKEAKKVAKERKKLEKAEKKRESLRNQIADKKREISKRERTIQDLKEDMELDKIKGKLSPNDITKINGKIEKERLALIKDKEKLLKLEQKLRKS